MGNGCMASKRVQVEDSSSHSFKVVVVGNSKSGKSSLIRRFIHNKFNEEYDETVSVDILSVVKKVNVPNHSVVSVEMWDIPGHDNIDLRKTYYRDVDAVIVVVDLSQENAIEFAASWKLDVLNHAKVTRHFTETVVTDDNKSTKIVQRKEFLPPKPGSIAILLVGNKYDLAKEKYLLEVEKETGIAITNGIADNNVESEEVKEEETENGHKKADKSEEINEENKKTSSNNSSGNDEVQNQDEPQDGDKEANKQDEELQPTDESKTTEVVETASKEESSETTSNTKPEDSVVPNGEVITSNGHVPHEDENISQSNGDVKMKKIFPKDLKHQNGGVIQPSGTHIEVNTKEPPSDVVDDGTESTFVETNILPACVEELETIADKYDFIAGIPVSAKTSNGGVHEAVQSLLRHLVVKKTFEIESSRKNNTKKIPHADATSIRTARSIVSKSSSNSRQVYDAGFEPLQDVGMIEIDDVILSCNPSLQQAEDVMTGFFTSVHRFKQLCKKSGFVRSSRCSLEECISAVKLAVAITIPSTNNDVIMKIQNEEEILRNPYYILMAEQKEEYLGLQIVDRNHDNAETITNTVSGELEPNSDFSEEVTNVLTEYRTEFQVKSCELVKKGSELENILAHNSKKLAAKEDKSWDLAVSAGLSHTEVRRMLLTIAQNKARVRGTLENLREANKTAQNYERKIRASLLF